MSQVILHTDQVVALCKKYHVSVLSLFGSTARGEAKRNSDIDLLVTFLRPTTLLQLVALERELSSALGRHVDLSTKSSLSPYLRKQIMKERQLVYAA